MKEKEFNLSVCVVCGKKFKKHYSQISCSDECKKIRKRQMEQKKNEEYGKKYFADSTRKYAHTNKSKIKEKAKRVYNENKVPALIRAKTRNYHEKRGICQECGFIGKTDFHHQPPMNPNVFVEVCKKCHNKIHGRELYVRQ